MTPGDGFLGMDRFALDTGTANDSLVCLREVGLLRQELEVERGGIDVRVPDQVVGDLWAQVVALDLMEDRLLHLMAQADLADLRALAQEIQSRCETAMRAAVAWLEREAARVQRGSHNLAYLARLDPGDRALAGTIAAAMGTMVNK